MNKRLTDSTDQGSNGSERLVNEHLSLMIETRVSELQDAIREEGRAGFSEEAISLVRVVCDFMDINGARIEPAVFEGDDLCPNIVYANKEHSKRLSIDLSADGRSIEIWKTNDQDSKLCYVGAFEPNQLRGALLWLCPSHRGKQSGKLDLAA